MKLRRTTGRRDRRGVRHTRSIRRSAREQLVEPGQPSQRGTSGIGPSHGPSIPNYSQTLAADPPQPPEEARRSNEPGLRLVTSQEGADLDVLVSRVARGDSQAFDSLYDEIAGPVFGLARRVVRDPARAEDVTQEVFLEVWRKAARFDRALGKGKTWIMTIAHRRAVDAVRRSESQKRQDRHGAPDEVSHDEPADAVIRDEEHGSVRDCLETLTDLQLES